MKVNFDTKAQLPSFEIPREHEDRKSIQDNENMLNIEILAM
jgi:hypothetical protein